MKGQRLYIIAAPGGVYKLGIADNPQTRLSALQTGSPVELRLLTMSEPLPNAAAVEREAHAMLATYRERGEWFRGPLYAIYRVGRVALLPPAVRARWRRMCQRPAFVARYVQEFALRCAVFRDEYMGEPAGCAAFIRELDGHRFNPARRGRTLRLP